jgi:mevalonate kinase
MARSWIGSAPAKAILSGEHAVVYGHPAVALPVRALSAEAELILTGSEGVGLKAPDLGISCRLPGAVPAPMKPLAELLELVQRMWGKSFQGCEITLRSEIPISRGLGSGAAVSVALIRALASFAERDPDPEEDASLAFEIEKLHHGTPSGVDNETIAHGRPVFFRKGEGVSFLRTGRLQFVLADSGEAPATSHMVEKVAEALKHPASGAAGILERIGRITAQIPEPLSKGDVMTLGAMMAENHRLLVDLGVSTPGIDELCKAAAWAKAPGAKLTGAGGGGFIMALCPPGNPGLVAKALADAGAHTVIETSL